MKKRVTGFALVCAMVMAVFTSATLAAPPQQLLVNGSFETGFTGWGTEDIAVPFVPLAVRGAGFTPGFGLFQTAPTNGSFVADSGFDGGGPGTIAIWQDVSIPAAAPGTVVRATLTFDWRAGWDMFNFVGSTLNRTLDFVVEPAGGGTPLQTTNVLTARAATMNLDTGAMSSAFDLSAYKGSAIRVEVKATIPQFFTGPAHLQLDNFSLLAQTFDKNDCKNGGWTTLLGLRFKNQGDCVSYFATGGKNGPG